MFFSDVVFLLAQNQPTLPFVKVVIYKDDKSLYNHHFTSTTQYETNYNHSKFLKSTDTSAIY